MYLELVRGEVLGAYVIKKRSKEDWFLTWCVSLVLERRVEEVQGGPGSCAVLSQLCSLRGLTMH